jgi:hypothetical protein
MTAPTPSRAERDSGWAVSPKLDSDSGFSCGDGKKWQYLDVYAKDTDFTWSVQSKWTPVTGTELKGLQNRGSGVITVSAGSCSYD